MPLTPKLPDVGTSIFAVMSGLAHECDAINLSQGFPSFDCAEGLKEKVFHHMKRGKNQYAPMPGIRPLRAAISDKVSRLYNRSLDMDEEITITAGATQALYVAITAIVDPGDEVIIFEPAYDSYGPAIRLSAGIPVPYEMSPPDYTIDWERVRSMIHSRTKLLFINTPHNPSGKVLYEADMKAIQAIIRDFDVYFIFDEVYEHLIFDDLTHQSALLYDDIYRRSMVIYSFGKTYHNTGWKMGYCIAPEFLTNAFRKIHQFNVFSVNTPIQYALADYMQNEETYLSLPDFYEKKRNFMEDIIRQTRFTPIKCHGTYFQLASYAEISDEPDLDFAQRITKEYGVASIPASPFYSKRTDFKVVRFCFAKSEEIMNAAGEQLIKI